MNGSRRVDEEQVITILAAIVDPPNRRDDPLPGDLEGDFDFWFDGGACVGHTGTQHFVFSDGTRVVSVFPAAWLHIIVEFADGRIVEIRQRREYC